MPERVFAEADAQVDGRAPASDSPRTAEGVPALREADTEERQPRRPLSELRKQTAFDSAPKEIGGNRRFSKLTSETRVEFQSTDEVQGLERVSGCATGPPLWQQLARRYRRADQGRAHCPRAFFCLLVPQRPIPRRPDVLIEDR
jgi:hypothetical protein